MIEELAEAGGGAADDASLVRTALRVVPPQQDRVREARRLKRMRGEIGHTYSAVFKVTRVTSVTRVTHVMSACNACNVRNERDRPHLFRRPSRKRATYHLHRTPA